MPIWQNPPTVTHTQLVSVHLCLVPQQECAKALDKEISRHTDGLAHRGRESTQRPRGPWENNAGVSVLGAGP